MPADSGEKSEAPTARRLQEAREKGQVAKSMDLTAALCLLVAMMGLNFFAADMTTQIMEFFDWALSLDRVAVTGKLAFEQGGAMAIKYLVKILGPIFLVLFLASYLSNLFQVGFMITSKPITPSFQKISPASGIKRLFSAQSAVKTVLSLAKVIIIGTVAGITIANSMNKIVALSTLSFIDIVAVAGQMTFILGIRMAMVLLVLALMDYAYQKYKHYNDLKMTKEEVKEEMKRMEGDPIMKQRRRAVARQLASQRTAQAVPKADVIVTNPTELALALKYDPDTMAAPKLVAKGSGYMAARIRRIALDSGVPIVERKPLARALYKSCEVGDQVPPELYKAVAEVLAYVFELNEKGFKRKTTKVN